MALVAPQVSRIRFSSAEMHKWIISAVGSSVLYVVHGACDVLHKEVGLVMTP